MKIPKPYFQNVSGVGDLEFKYCFYCLERPMLFVCTDNNNDYYLCSCYELFPELGWIIAKISTELLMDMINDDITLAYAFEQCNDKYIATWTNGDKYETIKKVEKFDSEILPMSGAHLDMEDNEYGDFISELKSVEQYINVQDLFEHDTNSEEIIHNFDDIIFEYKNKLEYKNKTKHDSESYEDINNDCVAQDEGECSIPVKYDIEKECDIHVKYHIESNYTTCIRVAA